MINQYILKSKDIPLVAFDYDVTNKTINGVKTVHYKLKITKVFDENKRLFPKNLFIVDDDSLLEWIKKRKAPNNRTFVEQIMSAYNDNSDPIKYVDVCKALSVNDAFWIENQVFPQKWDDINLYHHRFDEILAYVAFTGYTKKVKGEVVSPEPTTNGMQRKCWANRHDSICLLKGASELLDRNGRSEVYSEYYASQIASVLEFNHVDYEIEEFIHRDGKHEYISVCKAFTDENTGYVPFYVLLRNNNIKYDTVLSDYEKQLQFADFYGQEAFEDMMLFDSIIYNTDRHLGNFGMLVNNNDGTVIGPSPIFDNGMSLFVGAAKSDLKKGIQFSEYIRSLESKFDIDFDEQAYRFVQARHIPKLRKLSQYVLHPHPHATLNKEYFDLLKHFVQYRAKQIIEFYNNKVQNIRQNQNKKKS